MKQYKGKAIYNPTGKAGEYSKWACNFYTGCSNDCSYCYCKRGVLSSTWSKEPKLKKCFKDEEHALSILLNEIQRFDYREFASGMFFTFTSDPFLPETKDLTKAAIILCLKRSVPVIVLTKRSDWDIEGFVATINNEFGEEYPKEKISFGFTLTGCDELELGASSNEDRIKAMKTLHEAAFKTWASIEPIIDISRSLEMIKQTIGFCNLYKVGLQSGKKYDWRELRGFMLACTPLNSKFYFKDSFIEQARLDRDNLPKNCVTSDYNIFQ